MTGPTALGADRRPGERFVVLIRHGEAAAGWDGDVDPGLSDLGRHQAEEAAARLAVPPATPLVASPLRRTQETAAPIATALGVTPLVDAAVGEVVAPVGSRALSARGPWLRSFMAGGWEGAEASLLAWRRGVVDALEAVAVDTVFVTHFVAINAAVGVATGDDRVVCCRPGHCSSTVLRVGPEGLALVSLPVDAETEVR